MELFKNEMIKLAKMKQIFVVLIVSFLFIGLFITVHELDKREIFVEEAFTQEEIYLMNQEQIEWMIAEGKDSETALQKRQEINELMYVEEIPYDGYMTGAFFLFSEIVFGGFAMVILPFVIFLIGINMILGERNQGSLNFLLVSPAGRNKIIMAKFFALFVMLLITATVFIGSYLIYIAIQFGFSGWTDKVVMTFASPVMVPIWQAILIGTVLMIFNMLVYVTIGLLISVIFKNYAGAFIGFLTIPLLQATSGLYLGKIPLTEYIPFINLNLNSFLFLEGSTEMYGITFMFALLSTVVLLVVMYVLMIIIFNRRDYY